VALRTRAAETTDCTPLRPSRNAHWGCARQFNPAPGDGASLTLKHWSRARRAV